jgi:hypothetical protein
MSGTKGRFRLLGYEVKQVWRRTSGPLWIIEQWSSIVGVAVREYFIYLLIFLYCQAIVAILFYLTNP